MHAGRPLPGTPSEVLGAFLRLGCTSFGGPVAHLGYFRAEFVERRRWLPEAAFADLVAVCQALPGPTSSQVGFGLGFGRAGLFGALAAFAGFTLPSALVMALLPVLGARFASSTVGAAVVHALGLVAVAVVAQAVWGMARTLCVGRARTAIGLAGLLCATALPVSAAPLAAIMFGAAAGLVLLRGAEAASSPALSLSVRAGAICLLAFAALLAAALLRPGEPASAFIRAGALVFGGGHVVLPLLHDSVVGAGAVTEDAFVAGYGVAQALPGPLFTFATYLGATERGAVGAAVATVSIFLPGFLLLLGSLPFWTRLRARPGASAALAGVNAAVVGLLASALYDPVWTSAVHGPADFAIAAAGFVLLTTFRLPPLALVLAFVLLGLMR